MGLEVGLLGCVSLACLLTPLYSQFFCQQTRACTSQVTQSLSLKNRHSCQTKNTHVTLDMVRSRVHYLGRSQPEKRSEHLINALSSLNWWDVEKTGQQVGGKHEKPVRQVGYFPAEAQRTGFPQSPTHRGKGLIRLEDHRWSRKAGVGPILGSWFQQSTTKKTYWDN